jgi:hypothetical protein
MVYSLWTYFKTNNHLVNANDELCLFSQNPIGLYRLWFMLFFDKLSSVGCESHKPYTELELPVVYQWICVFLSGLPLCCAANRLKVTAHIKKTNIDTKANTSVSISAQNIWLHHFITTHPGDTRATKGRGSPLLSGPSLLPLSPWVPDDDYN